MFFLTEIGQFIACDDEILLQGILPVVDIGIVVVGAVEVGTARLAGASIVPPGDEETPVLTVGPHL